jgi:dCMP deaminase
LLQAGKEALDSILYCTGLPCPICFKLCIQAGIKKIVYKEAYRQEDVQYWIDNSNIEVVQWKI